jgi:hypothetical protein
MFNQYDANGKIFTNVISKITKNVIIQTSENLIKGKLHVRPNTRMMDEINQTQHFLAITEATIYNHIGTVLFITNFLAVNIDQVIWMIPQDDLNTGENT